MHASLFDQNLIMVLSLVTAILFMAFLWLIEKHKTLRKKIGISLGAGVVCTAIVVLLVKHFVGLNNTPAATFYLTVAVFALACLTITMVKSGWLTITLGACSTLSLILLELLIINGFYHYYPDLASLLPAHRTSYSNQTVVTKGKYNIKGGGKTLEEQLTSGTTQKGEVYSVSIPGTTSHFKARNGVVYLPAAYQNNETVQFPVLVLLNGTPGAPEDWLHGGNLQATADSFAGRHSGIAPIIIIPDHNSVATNDTECVNSSRGNVETYLANDVPAYIKANFRVRKDPDNWGIGGLSEGGMCAAMLTLRHQDTYLHFLDMSGEPAATLEKQDTTLQNLFNNSPDELHGHDIDWLLQNKSLNKKLTGQFVIGRDDKHSLVTSMQQTYTLMQSKNLTASLEIIPRGGHTFALWSQGFKDNIAKLSNALDATKCEATCGQ